jgi:hypothetical protein
VCGRVLARDPASAPVPVPVPSARPILGVLPFAPATGFAAEATTGGGVQPSGMGRVGATGASDGYGRAVPAVSAGPYSAWGAPVISAQYLSPYDQCHHSVG